MKTEPAKQAASRREFLRGSVRYTLLAGLAAVSVSLARRRGSRLPGQTCINEGVCRGCSVFDGCGLPQALSAKEATRRGDA
jgi:hypothetical protein